MDGGSARRPRLARGAAGSALGVLVALAAHLAAGGTAPAPAAVLVAVVLLQPAALLLAGRRHRLWRQAALVALGQAAMHAVFSLGALSTGMSAPTGMSGMPGMDTTLPAAAAVHAPDGMLAWHAAAWCITVAAWRWGALALARSSVLLIPSLVGAPVAVSTPAAPASPEPVGARRPQHARSVQGRGPPVTA